MSFMISEVQHTPFQLLFGFSILMISSLTGKKVCKGWELSHSIPLHSIFRVKEWRPNFRFHSLEWTHFCKETPPSNQYSMVSPCWQCHVCVKMLTYAFWIFSLCNIQWSVKMTEVKYVFLCQCPILPNHPRNLDDLSNVLMEVMTGGAGLLKN